MLDFQVMQDTQEMGVQSLAQEDPLEEEMATHSSILTWGIPYTEDIGRTMVHGIAEESDMTYQLNDNKLLHMILFQFIL